MLGRKSFLNGWSIASLFRTSGIPRWRNSWEEYASVDCLSRTKGSVNEQPWCQSQYRQTIGSRYLLVVNRHRGGDLVSLEIILAGLCQIGIVAFLILVGHLLHGRRIVQSSRWSSRSGNRLLPDRLELFRKRQRYSTLKRFSRLT